MNSPGLPNLVRTAGLCLFIALGATAPGQMPGGAAGGVNAALAKVLSSYPAFSARADARVLDSTQHEELQMPMDFAQRDGKIRIEIDISQIHSKNLPPQQVKEMKDAGLSHIVSIIRPDKKASYVLSPALQSYSIIPMPKEEAEMLGKNLKLESTPLGKETVDGHPCVRSRVTVSDGQKQVLEATTWNATDLKGFPIRIQTRENGKTSTLQFHAIQFRPPDPLRFDPPPGYRLAQ